MTEKSIQNTCDMKGWGRTIWWEEKTHGGGSGEVRADSGTGRWRRTKDSDIVSEMPWWNPLLCMLTLKINQKNCIGQNNPLNYLIYFQSPLLGGVIDHITVEFRDSGITDYNTAHFNPKLMFLNLCVILVFPSSVSLQFMSKGFYKISHEIERERWILQKQLDSQDRPNLFACLSVCLVFCPGICICFIHCCVFNFLV